MWRSLVLVPLIILSMCAPSQEPEAQTQSLANLPPATDTLPAPAMATKLRPKPVIDYDTTKWLEMIALDSTIAVDVRYATANNFVGEPMYECGRCFFRPEVAQALLAAHRELQTKGMGLKFFDCYRPRPVQWKLWNKVPDPRFVADPRKGSVHNKGGAADLTIVYADGRELDMGVPFDFFGPEGYHDYAGFPDSVLQNRRLLRETMARHGLAHIRTEWWHYNYRPKSYRLSDWEWPCNH